MFWQLDAGWLGAVEDKTQARAEQPAATQTRAARRGEPTCPKSVATTGVICDITKEIAQSSIDTTCLIKPGDDPHAYQTKPEDRKAIETGNLILYGLRQPRTQHH